MKLHDLQQGLIDLFGQMSEAAVVNTDLLAAPFLSVEPEFYDPHNHKTILYVGKATGKDWYLSEFLGESNS